MKSAPREESDQLGYLVGALRIKFVKNFLHVEKGLALLFAYWVILHAFLTSADYFQNQLFEKILSQIPSECQTVWIQIWPDVLSGLIWVRSVCKEVISRLH